MAEEEKCPSIPQNVFLLLLRYLPVVSFKKIKTNKAVLTIVIDLENILHWSLVKCALDKEDSSVPVYSPYLNFCICNFSV